MPPRFTSVARWRSVRPLVVPGASKPALVSYGGSFAIDDRFALRSITQRHRLRALVTNLRLLKSSCAQQVAGTKKKDVLREPITIYFAPSRRKRMSASLAPSSSARSYQRVACLTSAPMPRRLGFSSSAAS